MTQQPKKALPIILMLIPLKKSKEFKDVWDIIIKQLESFGFIIIRPNKMVKFNANKYRVWIIMPRNNRFRRTLTIENDLFSTLRKEVILIKEILENKELLYGIDYYIYLGTVKEYESLFK